MLPTSSERNLVVAWALGGAILLLAFTATATLDFVKPIRPIARAAVSMIGKPASKLVSIIGEPRYVVHAGDLQGRTVDYPWKDMNFVPIPTRPVRSKVLPYSKINFAIYVYVDENDRITYVAEAAT